MKDALKAVEGDNIDLNREIDALKVKLENSKPQGGQKKRKKPDEDVVPVPRSPKRSKQDVSSIKGVTGTIDSTADFDFTSIGEVGKVSYLFDCFGMLLTNSRQHSDAKLLSSTCTSQKP